MRFRYLGDDARTFGHVSLTVEPGDVIEADENPDPQRFERDDEPFGTPVQADEATPEEEY